ncbi:TPA: SDR family oxidoreductase [Candidatus Micrarchaeota archaeon]|nr:SDR family oxidoreductase [Candidatus Micrarchaeota archaeon]
MSGRTVLISGGTDGIGKGAALQLLKEGFNVSTFSRDAENCSELQKELGKLYDESRFLVMKGDVADDKDMENAVAGTVAKFGSIDILINNAGFGYFSECDAVDISRFRKMIDTNLVGMALLTKLAVPHMKEKGAGLIINISSMSGKRALMKGEFYSATKFAVMGYSEGLRKELGGWGIKVSTICPGMVRTDFFDKAHYDKQVIDDSTPMLDVDDISRIISLICNQSGHCDIQDLSVMPFVRH